MLSVTWVPLILCGTSFCVLFLQEAPLLKLSDSMHSLAEGSAGHRQSLTELQESVAGKLQETVHRALAGISIMLAQLAEDIVADGKGIDAV